MTTGAIILAAGVSSRMKEFKPMMCVGRKPMILNVVDTLKAVGADPIAAVTGYRADTIARCLQGTGVITVRNRAFASTMMLDSLAVGLREIGGRCDRVVVFPADVPMVKPSTVTGMLLQTGDAVIPVCSGNEGHPVVISSSLFGRICASSPGTKLRDILSDRDVDVVRYATEDPGILMDANTYEEYLQLLNYNSRMQGKGTFHLEYNLRLAVDDATMDNDMMLLLEMLEYTGSLQTASECVNSSYTGNWRRIKQLEKQLGVTLVASAAGGQKGGGTSLTEAGRCLLDAYGRMQREGEKMMNMLFKEYFTDDIIKKIQNSH